jgi:potassium efflux system protein
MPPAGPFRARARLVALVAALASPGLAASAALAQPSEAQPAVAPAAVAPAPASVAAAPIAVASPPVPGASSAAAAPAIAPEDDWIRPEDIADRAKLLTSRLESRVTTDAARATVQQIEKKLARLDDELTAAFEQARVALGGKSSLMQIQDARRELRGASEPFDAWKQQLEAEARRVSDVLAESDAAHQRWSHTLARVETAQAGEAIVRRVESSLAQIQQAKSELTEWRVRVLALSDRLLDRTTTVAGTIEKLEAETIAESASVLVPDQRPIWNRDIGAQLTREMPEVPAKLAQFSNTTAEYFRADVRPFVLQLLLWIVCLLAVRRLPERSLQRLATAHISPESLRLLTRPYAIVTLLVLATSPSMHPTAPQRVMQLFGILALVPVARVLMLANQRSNFSLYFGLFALLLLDRLSISVSSLPAVVLVLFFVKLAIAASVGMEYRRRLRAEGSRSWLASALEIALAGVLLSMVAEIGGWTSLAALLGRGILVGATAGLYVYAIAISIEALFAYALASPALRASRFVDHNQALVQRWMSLGIRILAALYWANLVVNALGLSDIVADLVDRVFGAGISVGALSISLGGVLAFVFTLLLAMALSRLLHEILEDEVFPRAKLPRGIPNALLTLTSYAIWSLGFVLALAAAGVQLSQLAILVGGLGVGIGLGLQDVVKNFAAGITLLLERRLHVGDAVQIPDKNVFGRILSIGMRASVVRNWNGTEAIMPNDDLVSGTVTNWTLSDQTHRVEVKVGVAYGNDPAPIIDLLLSVARADGRFLEHPAPVALFTGFGESSLDFTLRAWSDEPYETNAVRASELAVAVHAALKEAGIEIPFPQREVNVTNVAPRVAELLRGDASRPKRPADAG